MNERVIKKELEKRNVPFSFFQSEFGTALRFFVSDLQDWNALLPIDDKDDIAFCYFVESNYKRLHPKKVQP